MPRVEFEPKISADERPQTYALDRAATGTGLGITGLDVINIDVTWRMARQGNDLPIPFIPQNIFFYPS